MFTNVNFSLEGAVEAVFPALQRGGQRHVLRAEFKPAGAEHIAQIPFIDHNGVLAFTHGQLRAVLDLMVFAVKAVNHRTGIVLRPFDHIHELSAEFLE